MNTNTEIKNELNEMTTITKIEFSTMWKIASNDKRRKPTFVEEKHNLYNDETKKYEPFMQKVKVKGFLYPEHHILYNAVRGLPLSRGFGAETDGYLSALSFFRSSFYNHYLIEKLYQPFKEKMTLEQFDGLIREAKALAIS